MLWMWCLFVGQSSSFVAMYLFSVDYGTQTGVDISEKKTLWTLIGGLEASFFIFFAFFLSSMNRKYITTFFTTLTAKQSVVRIFRAAPSDLAKFDVFTNHESFYANIRGEVKDWVLEKYESWIDESPVWFTDRVKAGIPDDMVPERSRSSSVKTF